MIVNVHKNSGKNAPTKKCLLFNVRKTGAPHSY